MEANTAFSREQASANSQPVFSSRLQDSLRTGSSTLVRTLSVYQSAKSIAAESLYTNGIYCEGMITTTRTKEEI